jgi:hypothetical protein
MDSIRYKDLPSAEYGRNTAEIKAGLGLKLYRRTVQLLHSNNYQTSYLIIIKIATNITVNFK